MSATKQSTRGKAPQNGKANGDTAALVEAKALEDQIATEAATIREDATELDRALFLRLWPLLARPLPAGFVQHIGVVTGKPYESTGVKSLQVLIDRMNNVLTPLWWWYEVEYLLDGEDHGKLAEVTVYVGTRGGDVLTQATSRGGVNQASTLGNRYKGSETNAAKRAFAQIGPGHEVYLGAVDLDPDVSVDAAKAQQRADRPAPTATIEASRAALLIDAFQGLPGGDDIQAEHRKQLKLKLGSLGVSGQTVNAAFAKLTPGQADDVERWLSERADLANAEGSS